MPNRLGAESSPYLLQHAHNPVEWYPWGPEALERAVEEDRPILLSVGYSSCHWCHVMERESFENPAIAEQMNRLFVNVKVDREERPDIDQIYMKAVQAMTGRGGWPMTVFLTPARIPFFGGTYYPPEPQPGMPSFPQVMEAVYDAWTNRRDDVRAGGERLMQALESTLHPGASGSAEASQLVDAARSLQNQFDATWGGFGRAPKFPQPVALDFLLAEHGRTAATLPLDMAVLTLRRMAAGGMRDHVGGGFHRYSVDERWLVPHFEKMLYDNALLARVYVEAWRHLDSDDVREVAEATLDYLVDDLRDDDGRFYSARDADSEGVEGRFYVWTPTEVDDVLGPEDGALFRRAYDITDGGNFEGESIPHLPHELSAIAHAEGVTLGHLESTLERSRRALATRRALRPAPFRDEKALTSWNGFAIRAFAEAGAAMGRDDYVDVARSCASRLWDLHRADGRLLHSSMGSTAKHHAFLDDHGALANAFLALHAATLDPIWFERVVWLCDEIVRRFWDNAEGVVYDTPNDAEALIVRPREAMDHATPSGASLAAEAFARLGRLRDSAEDRARAHAIVDLESEHLGRYAAAYGRMLTALERLVAPPVEIVVTGPTLESTAPLLRAAHRVVHPGVVITGAIGGSGPSIPLLEGRLLSERPMAYVCADYTCRLPVEEPAQLHAEVEVLLG
ncbi:MAG: thioredoxin domain-containing protein [Gemmatimonadota bacterium]